MRTAAELLTDLDDVQGLILRGYRHPNAAYLFLRFPTSAAGRSLLGNLIEVSHLTSAHPWPIDPSTGESRKPSTTTNVALSYQGLTALGLSQARLDSFPEAFRQGMAARAQRLSDVGASAPDQWVPGLNDGVIHAVLVLYADTDVDLAQHVAAMETIVKDSGVTHASNPLFTWVLPGGIEHFGFRDGLSQPSIEGISDHPGGGEPIAGGQWRPIKPGEFVLGYEAERALPPLPAPIANLCLNGTYVVLRKLAQDVAAFRTFLKQAAEVAYGSDSVDAQERLGAMCVGRWKSGAPVSLSPTVDSGVADNDFRFGTDPDGMVCPRGAHIRRTNPRDALDGGDVVVQLHRLLRRGMTYGPLHDDDPATEKGLVFVVMNADLEDQFEFIQEHWVNDGDFVDLRERDPIGGDNSDGAFSIPGADQNPFVFGLEHFVTTRGGGYFLMPGLSALRWLADANNI